MVNITGGGFKTGYVPPGSKTLWSQPSELTPEVYATQSNIPTQAVINDEQSWIQKNREALSDLLSSSGININGRMSTGYVPPDARTLWTQPSNLTPEEYAAQNNIPVDTVQADADFWTQKEASRPIANPLVRQALAESQARSQQRVQGAAEQPAWARGSASWGGGGWQGVTPERMAMAEQIMKRSPLPTNYGYPGATAPATPPDSGLLAKLLQQMNQANGGS